jgi:hypothetical protein
MQEDAVPQRRDAPPAMLRERVGSFGVHVLEVHAWLEPEFDHAPAHRGAIRIVDAVIEHDACQGTTSM